MDAIGIGENGGMELPRQDGVSSAHIRSAGSDSDRFVCSFAQYRVWFLQQMGQGTGIFNLSVALDIHGPLEPTLLKRALDSTIERHRSLRTNVALEEDVPLQVVRDEWSLDMPEHDLGGLGPEKRQAEVSGLTELDAQTPFDLENDLLVRANLYRLGGQDHVLQLTVHQMGADDRSLEIFCRELFTLYESLLNGRSTALAALPIDYADFADRQRQRFSGEVLQQELEYWRKRLSGLAPELGLPVDQPRSAETSYATARHPLSLTEDLSQALTVLSSCSPSPNALLEGEGTLDEAVSAQPPSDSHSVPLSTLLMAVFAAMLQRHTGEDDIILGSQTPNRQEPELTTLVGLFRNILAYRFDLSGNPTFVELVQQVHETIEETRRHQELPFEMLVQELSFKRDPGVHPVFQVLFAFDDPLPEFECDGLCVRPAGVAVGASMMDLTLRLENRPDGLHGWIEYNADLFNADTIARMADHFVTLAKGAVEDPNRPLSELPLLTKAERQETVVQWNQSRCEFPDDKCVHHLFRAQARRDPDALAVAETGRRITYGELDRWANRLAWTLIEAGVQPDQLVGIYADRSIAFVAGMLGIVKAGGAYVPLDPSYPEDRLAYIIEDTQASIILAQRKLLGKMPETNAVIIDLDDPAAIAGSDRGDPEREYNSTQLAYVIYTSGSTGKPKGVMLQHQGLVNLCHWYHQARQATPADRMTQLAKTGFDHSVGEIWPCLTCGASLHIPDSDTARSPSLLMDWLVKERITITDLPTALANAIFDLPWPEDISLRAIIAGGDKLHKRPSQAVTCPVFDQYGPTENSVSCTEAQVPAEGQAGESMTIGRPIPNHTAYILDKHLNPVPVGVTGELHLGGAGLARGYLNRPDLTAEKFIAHPFSDEPGARLYKTGDLARFLPDGKIQFLGRIDFQVKIRGFRIELGEIETCLRQHPEVNDAVVLALDDHSGEKHLVGYCVAEEQAHGLSADALREYLSASLPPSMVPHRYVILDEFPLTPNHKIDRKALSAHDLGPADAEERSIVTPRNDIERDMVAIWEEVLDVEPIGITDNFFDLGGHSLRAAILLAKIKEKLGHSLGLSILFSAPTIEELSGVLQRNLELGTEGCLVPLNEEGSKPPIFLVAGVGGHVFTFHKFSRLLGPDQPTYGLKAIGVDGEQVPPETMEEIAAHYLQEITAIRPTGPYILGGYSIGARIAFELALQLQAKGHQVAYVTVFDMIAPGYPKRLPLPKRILIHLKSFLGLRGEERLSYLKDRINNVKEKVLLRLGFGIYVAPEIAGAEGLPQDALKHVYVALRKADQAYWPARKLDGKIVLFKAEEGFDWPATVFDDPTMGWGDWSTHDVEEHVVPGAHLDVFNDESLELLAESVNDCTVRLASPLASPDG